MENKKNNRGASTSGRSGPNNRGASTSYSSLPPPYMDLVMINRAVAAQRNQPVAVVRDAPIVVQPNAEPVASTSQGSQPVKIKTEPSTSPSIKKKRGRPRGKNLPQTNCPNLKKESPTESSRPVFVPITSESLVYNGTLFTRGDVVSVIGSDDRVYYAQIRGLLQDQYNEKIACITWLFPTTDSPRDKLGKDKFDPKTYIIGHEEDIPRELKYFQFVSHSPSEYYMCKNPVPSLPPKPELGFAKTSKGYVVVKLPAVEFNTDSE